MEFKLMNETIEFNNDFVLYNHFRNLFSIERDKKLEDFLKKYEKTGNSVYATLIVVHFSGNFYLKNGPLF